MRLKDVKLEGEWSALEQRLLDCTASGDEAMLQGKEECPTDSLDCSRRVRAKLIRFLLLGGNEKYKTSAKGVRLCGAWIDGKIDFRNEKTRLNFALRSCLFADEVDFTGAEVRGFYLEGSHARKGLELHRLQTEKSVSLTSNFRADKKVELCEAIIGSNLNLYNANFKNDESPAINCKDATIAGSVNFFKKVFNAEIDHKISASLEHLPARTDIDGGFDGEAMTVGSRFVWLGVNGNNKGTINLRDARVNMLVDDFSSWDSFGKLIFDGLTCDRLYSEVTVGQRLTLLHRNDMFINGMRENYNGIVSSSLGVIFQPQPYTQLAKVLGRAGDRSSASQIRNTLSEKRSIAHFDRSCDKARVSAWRIFPYIEPVFRRYLFDKPFGIFFGYGYRPTKVLRWIVGLLIASTLLYGRAFDMGEMAPNSDVILTSFDWQRGLSTGGNPLQYWLQSETAKDYETFSPILYAIDLLIPLDIGQQAAWAPSLDRGCWGKLGYWLRMPIQLIGWLTVAVAAAVVTGLIGKSDE
jgi:hypothetical protein